MISMLHNPEDRWRDREERSTDDADYADGNPGQDHGGCRNPNLTVRTNATHELIRRKPIDLELHNRGPLAKAHGLWVYHGQGRITADVANSAARSSARWISSRVFASHQTGTAFDRAAWRARSVAR